LEKKLKILGYISLGMGMIAALICFLPLGIFYAMPIGFFGLLISSAYIYIDTKNQVNTKKVTPGIIGMVLSSLPVIFMLIFIIMSKMKS
jgi:hypothetical protein